LRGKHFVGHGVTEGGLNMNQNNITERELREVHCKPFQAAISEAGLMAVMNSYCNVNREPIISSKRILTDLLREEMGFKGVLVSDYVSIDRFDPASIGTGQPPRPRPPVRV
jgi:beta-glucosidase